MPTTQLSQVQHAATLDKPDGAGKNGAESIAEPPVGPKAVSLTGLESEDEQDELLRNAWPPFSAYLFDWLKTPQGAELAKLATQLMEAVKHRTVDQQLAVARHNHRREIIHVTARYALLVLVLGLAAALRWQDKLDSVMVGILAAAMGYVFGRQRTE